MLRERYGNVVVIDQWSFNTRLSWFPVVGGGLLS